MFRTDTGVTILLLCDDCPSWRVHAATRLAARQVAARHEETHHPESRLARRELWRYLHRSTPKMATTSTEAVSRG